MGLRGKIKRQPDWVLEQRLSAERPPAECERATDKWRLRHVLSSYRNILAGVGYSIPRYMYVQWIECGSAEKVELPGLQLPPNGLNIARNIEISCSGSLQGTESGKEETAGGFGSHNRWYLKRKNI